MELSISLTKKRNEANILIPNNLKVVCEAIDKRCEISGQLASNCQFMSLLETLDYVERSFIANYFCQLPWNVSSVKVLGSLNKLHILTATEFILSQTDDEHIQLVLNDFLETEFDLLANLIICGHFDLMIGSKIAEYIDESFRRLFVDLWNNSKLNNLEYLKAIACSLPKDLHAKVVNNHLKSVLLMHKSSIRVAFLSFTDWIEQNLEQYEVVTNFYKNAVAGNELDVVKNLFSISSASRFIGWRNYLLLLGLITKNCQPQCYSFIKKWLKDRLKIVAECGSREFMSHLLLSIRTVLLFQQDKSETYAQWYKQNIGDMKFVLNTTDFKTMIAVLADLVPYETDEKYLQVHVKISISPPVMCGQLCRDYKLLCRTRIADIIDCTKIMVLDEDLFSDIE